jgi:hypothetical protein
MSRDILHPRALRRSSPQLTSYPWQRKVPANPPGTKGQKRTHHREYGTTGLKKAKHHVAESLLALIPLSQLVYRPLL